MCAPGLSYGANYIDRLISIERRELNGNNTFYLCERSPKLVGEQSSTYSGLQVETHERDHLGKDVEQSAVLGEIAPAADIGHPKHARIELRVNGETKQSSDISQLIHSVPAVIAHLSQYYHLQPGDLIYTGTPEGVGPVKPGDRLEGSIEGVGTIATEIGAA